MSTTLRPRIVLSLPSCLRARHDMMMSALASGWVEVTYRMADGSKVTRLATRNPTLVGTYDSRVSLVAIRNSDNDWEATNLVYYDYMRGGIRSFYVESLVQVAIPADCPENDH